MKPCAAVTLTAALCGLLLASRAGADNPTPSASDCEALHQAVSGQSGKDVIWLATPDALVNRMLTLAGVTAADHVIDLGAGDGKIALAAARRFGATALGIEYNADLVELARCIVTAEGMDHRVRIIQGDIFVEDFSSATVVTLFLLPHLNRCIRHRLLAMPPGTRVLSHQFRMGEWRADEMTREGQRVAYLWIVPARVGGVWTFRDANGVQQFSVDFEQTYQDINGRLTIDGDEQHLSRALLHGAVIDFEFRDRDGRIRKFHGEVRDAIITGTLQQPGAPAMTLNAEPHYAPRPAAWAAMFPGCESFYRP